MSKHIRALNPVIGSKDSVREACFTPCYVMPCDCAGPGGLCYIYIPPIKHFEP